MTDAFFICADCENPDCDGRSCQLPRFGRFAPAPPPIRFRRRKVKVVQPVELAVDSAPQSLSSFRAWLKAGMNDGEGTRKANQEIWEQVAGIVGGKLDTHSGRQHANIVMQDDSIHGFSAILAFNLLQRYGKPK